MKNTTNTIVALFILVIGSAQTYGMNQEEKHLVSALDYGVKNDQFFNNDFYSGRETELTTIKPTHSVSIIANPYTYGDRTATSTIGYTDLNTLKNKIGEEGLNLIHNELIE